jgi:hypothetical protein
VHNLFANFPEGCGQACAMLRLLLFHAADSLFLHIFLSQCETKTSIKTLRHLLRISLEISGFEARYNGGQIYMVRLRKKFCLLMSSQFHKKIRHALIAIAHALHEAKISERRQPAG